MPESTTYITYKAYVTNVSEFQIAESEVRRTINRALKTNKSITVKVYTKLYAILYSTYSESNFMKMILTPYGFDQKYIDEILEQDNVQKKWIKCLDLAFAKFSLSHKNSEIPNKKLALKRIIIKYIIDPSVIRNKIAHGQLTVALNKSNKKLNLDLTKEIDLLDYVLISRWFKINNYLARIIEDLIESPNIAHHNHYYSIYQELEAFIQKSSSWTVESKMQRNSMKKQIRYQQND